MPGTLNLSRDGFGIELRRGTFDVLVDGSVVGTTTWRKTVELPVEPGNHALQIRKGRYSSRVRSFEVTDGEVVFFRCHGTMIWPGWVVSAVKPDLAISLKRQV